MDLEKYCENHKEGCVYGEKNQYDWSYNVASWVRVHSKWNYNLEVDLG